MKNVSSPWLTVTQAARYVHMDQNRMRELVYAGTVQSHMRGSRGIFVHTDDLDAYMRSMPSAARVPVELRCVS